MIVLPAKCCNACLLSADTGLAGVLLLGHLKHKGFAEAGWQVALMRAGQPLCCCRDDVAASLNDTFKSLLNAM